MEIIQIINLLNSAIEEGMQAAFHSHGQNQEELSKSDTYRLYGRTNVDRWCNEGLIIFLPSKIHPIRKTINRKKMEAVAASSNRMTYLPVADR